jgi:hypothetical protein
MGRYRATPLACLKVIQCLTVDYGSILHDTWRLNHVLVAESFFEKLIVAKVVRNFLKFLELVTSVPCSQELLTGPCLDPVHFNLYLISLTLCFNTLASMLCLQGGVQLLDL